MLCLFYLKLPIAWMGN